MVAHTVAKTASERTIFFAELIKVIAHLTSFNCKHKSHAATKYNRCASRYLRLFADTELEVLQNRTPLSGGWTVEDF